MKFGKGMNLNCFPYRGESILFSQNFIPLFFFPTTRIETSIHRSLIKSIRHRSLSCLLFINETTILIPHYGLLVSFYIRIYFLRSETSIQTFLKNSPTNPSIYISPLIPEQFVYLKDFSFFESQLSLIITDNIFDGVVIIYVYIF